MRVMGLHMPPGSLRMPRRFSLLFVLRHQPVPGPAYRRMRAEGGKHAFSPLGMIVVHFDQEVAHFFPVGTFLPV